MMVMLKVLFWAIGFHIVIALGITIGYHRLLTHRSFQCPKWLEYCWTLLGFLSLMGPPTSWVSVHRFHHANTDKPLDPHSPVQGGWWWSQVGWMLHRVRQAKLVREGKIQEDYEWANTFTYDSAFVNRWAHDLKDDPFHRRLTFEAGLWLWAFSVVLALALGGWPCVLGRLIATFTVVWSTWFVNSYGHSEDHGYRNFETRDSSRNVWWVALLTNGEGWHNNHHHRPQSARHGMTWFEFDLSWCVIWLMKTMRLATKVHTFKVERQEKAAA